MSKIEFSLIKNAFERAATSQYVEYYKLIPYNTTLVYQLLNLQQNSVYLEWYTVQENYIQIPPFPVL